jgi:hypothetical protein
MSHSATEFRAHRFAQAYVRMRRATLVLQCLLRAAISPKPARKTRLSAPASPSLRGIPAPPTISDSSSSTAGDVSPVARGSPKLMTSASTSSADVPSSPQQQPAVRRGSAETTPRLSHYQSAMFDKRQAASFLLPRSVVTAKYKGKNALFGGMSARKFTCFFSWSCSPSDVLQGFAYY